MSTGSVSSVMLSAFVQGKPKVKISQQRILTVKEKANNLFKSGHPKRAYGCSFKKQFKSLLILDLLTGKLTQHRCDVACII